MRKSELQIDRHAVSRYQERCAKEHLSYDAAALELTYLLVHGTPVEQPPWVDEQWEHVDVWIEISSGIVVPLSGYERGECLHAITVLTRAGQSRFDRVGKNRLKQAKRSQASHRRSMQRRNRRKSRHLRYEQLDDAA